MSTGAILNTPRTTDIDMISVNQNAARANATLRAKSKAAMEQKADAVSQEFEAQFISQMLENMFSTIDTKESLGGNESEDIYRSMVVDEYGKLISRTGGIGVADHVKREMLKLQEVE